MRMIAELFTAGLALNHWRNSHITTPTRYLR